MISWLSICFIVSSATPTAMSSDTPLKPWNCETPQRLKMIAGSMDPDKVLRVMGVGPVVPLNKGNTLDPMNRRIAIVVLNQAAQQRILHSTELAVEEGGDLKKAVDRIKP